MLDRREFAVGLAVLSAGIGKEIPEATVAVWYDVLCDLNPAQLKAGILAVLKESQYSGLPPVGVIRKAALGGASERLAVTDRGQLAWEKVIATIRSVGGYASVQFDDPIVTAAVRSLGSWADICGKTIDELVWVKKEFLSAYAAMLAGGISAEQARPLHGIINCDRSRDGFPLEPVKLIETGLPAVSPRLIRGEVQHAPRLPSPATKNLSESFHVPE